MGLAMMPLRTAGMNSVPPAIVNRASALQNTLSNVASSVGVAMMGTIMTTHSNLSFASYMQNIGVQSLQRISAYGRIPSVFGVTSQSDMLNLMTMLKQVAFQNGIREAFIVAFFVTGIAFIASIFVGKKQKPAYSKE